MQLVSNFPIFKKANKSHTIFVEMFLFLGLSCLDISFPFELILETNIGSGDKIQTGVGI